MSRMELMSPAGSFECMVAAVQNGADAIYVGGSEFNARKGAKNFDDDELSRAAEYCHINGVRLVLALNTLVSDREASRYFEKAAFANRIGIDAIIVQDIGMAKLIKQSFPDMPIYASTQMTVTSLDSVKILADAGFSRAVLARELPLCDVEYICKNSPIEIEVFAHGALCMCYSGQCYMSSVIGARSGNRGRCAQPCRLAYGIDKKGNDYLLSLKDLCTLSCLKELQLAGVAAIKIEGRMKRPEYVAIVTSIYDNILRTMQPPTPRDMQKLQIIFSRDGFTNAYLEGKKGPHMFGTHTENENTKEFRDLISEAQRSLGQNFVRRRVDVNFNCSILKDMPVKVTVIDGDGNSNTVEGDVPQAAITRPTGIADINNQFEKTGGTPYFTKSVEADIEPGLAVAASQLNDLRRRALEGLTDLRKIPKKRREVLPVEKILHENSKAAPDLSVEAASYAQLSKGLLSLKPKRVYLPIDILCSDIDAANDIISSGIELCPKLPRAGMLAQQMQLRQMLKDVCGIGIKTVLCTNLSHALLAKEYGLMPRGDFSLNIFNSRSVMFLKELGFKSCTLSFELERAMIRDISKYIPCEIMAYGKLALMLTENCVIKDSYAGCNKCRENHTLVDRKGEAFLIRGLPGCRNEILNAHPLYLADKISDFSKLGLESLRIVFSDETPKEAVRIFEKYLAGDIEKPDKFTRGLYYKGIE